MAKDAVIQVRIDPDMKARAEELFGSMGTSLSEAVRMFVYESVAEQRLPFIPKAHASKGAGRAFGMLSTYARPSLRADERQAWIESLSTAHDHHRR